MQAVALVEFQVSVELAPLVRLVGLALSETVGTVGVTVTVADCAAEPPAPVQVSVNFVVAVRVGVAFGPLVVSAPLQPPDARHEAALVDDQLNVEAVPLLTVLGLAVSVTAGAGVVTDTVADCDALPPVPVQVRP